MINNPVGLKAEHIAGESNILADKISRIYNSSYSEYSFHNLFQEYPQMKLWSRFHPSQELCSSLFTGLLVGAKVGYSRPKTLGHFKVG